MILKWGHSGFETQPGQALCYTATVVALRWRNFVWNLLNLLDVKTGLSSVTNLILYTKAKANSTFVGFRISSKVYESASSYSFCGQNASCNLLTLVHIILSVIKPMDIIPFVLKQNTDDDQVQTPFVFMDGIPSATCWLTEYVRPKTFCAHFLYILSVIYQNCYVDIMNIWWPGISITWTGLPLSIKISVSSTKWDVRSALCPQYEKHNNQFSVQYESSILFPEHETNVLSSLFHGRNANAFVVFLCGQKALRLHGYMVS